MPQGSQMPLEISKLADMNYRSAGELARRFERDMKKTKKLVKLVEKTEKILAEE